MAKVRKSKTDNRNFMDLPKKEKDDRIVVRLNRVERAQLELLKAKYHINYDSEALKIGMKWSLAYIENVTELFFPSGYDVILQRKKKTSPLGRQVY